MGPLLTRKVHDTLQAAARAGAVVVECSLDLDRSITTVEVGVDGWTWQGRRFPYLSNCKDRTIYHWADAAFEPVARYSTALYKLVPTDWGAPTFEIDGIKMLPTAHVSPYVVDASTSAWPPKRLASNKLREMTAFNLSAFYIYRG